MGQARSGFFFALSTVVLWGALFLTACAIVDVPVGPSPPGRIQEKRAETRIYRSREFVVYFPGGKEDTPARLAKRFLGDPSKAWVIEDANEGKSFPPGRPVIIPLQVRNRGGLERRGYQVVPVLCYHRFSGTCRTPLCMPAGVFEAQMRLLKEQGYRIIPMRDLLDFLYYRKGLPKRSVVLTIDDGHRSTYEIAYPILKKFGFTATLFVYTDFVGVSDSAVTWTHLRDMQRAGFAVGSHTVTHCDLTEKEPGEDDSVYLERIQGELLGSKRIIDRELDRETLYLAYPYGHYDQRILRLSEKSGYKMAFSVKRGSNPFFADPLALKRRQILAQDMGRFERDLQTFYPFDLR